MLKDAIKSLSLANLCFIKVWSKLLSSAGSYFNEFPVAYLSIIVNVVVLAAVFFTCLRLWRRFRGVRIDRVQRFISFLIVLTVVNGIVSLIAAGLPITPSGAMARNSHLFGGILITGAVAFVFFKWQTRILNALPGLLMILSPFVVLTFTQSIWKINSRPSMVAYAAERPAEKLEFARKRPATRVIWIIFDELDERLAFVDRPLSVKLPELDRLRQQSVSAGNAYPPAPLTYMSMPALITGRLVSRVTPVASNELLVNFDGDKTASRWSKEPNVFSDARKAGFNTGLAGWCHPYCKVIGSDLTKCLGVNDDNAESLSLPHSMMIQAEGLVGTAPMIQQIVTPLVQRVGFLNEFAVGGERRKYIARYKSVLEDAKKFAVDTDLDLILIHSPAPHPPGIYDRRTGEFSLKGTSSYLDNLALVDRTVGELRRLMEGKGVWDSTVLLISADHWWRTEMWQRGPFWTAEAAAVATEKMDHRIPFILKLNGQKEPVVYDQKFNTVLTHDLLLALLKGEATTSAEVTKWLDDHRSIGDSPYNRDEMLP